MTTKAKYQITTFVNNIFNEHKDNPIKKEVCHEIKYLISALEKQYGFCFTGF